MTMSATTVSERYFRELPRLKAALRLSESEFSRAAREVDSSAVVNGRVKSHRSVLGKVYRKGKARSWESLGDLVALKAVFPTRRGVIAFCDWLMSQSAWNPNLEVRKSDADKLGYESAQFDLWCEALVDRESRPIKIELQVRTAAADAWYVVDHRLRYKGAVELPSELQRKLYRLIVLTELFDEEVEAVIAHQATLPEYGLARLYERLTQEVDGIIGGRAKTSRPEGLLELIVQAYTDAEMGAIDELVSAFVDTHRPKIQAIVMGHLHDADDFVESRDWLYYEPETLLLAERSVVRPALIEAKLQGTDFEYVTAPMLTEFKRALS